MKSELLFVIIYLQVFFLGALSSTDSCYYCTGTPSCGDPMDYNEVSPRDCLEDSICLKYVSSSKNQEGIVVAHGLTYRKCFQPLLIAEDTCTFVKSQEEEAIRDLNHKLVSFECYTCEDTNCNTSSRSKGSFLTWICIFLIFLDFLSIL